MHANKNGENGKQAAEAAASHALYDWNWVREMTDEEEKGSRRLSQARYINVNRLYLTLRGRVYSYISIFFLPAPNFAVNFFFFRCTTCDKNVEKYHMELERQFCEV